MKRKQKSTDVELNQLMEAFLRPAPVAQSSRALLLPYSVGMGAGAVLIVYYTLGPDPVAYLTSGLIGMMIPTTVYGFVRGAEHIMQGLSELFDGRRELQIAKIEAADKKEIEKYKLELADKHVDQELHNKRMELSIQRAKLQVQYAEAEARRMQAEARLNTVIENGVRRVTDPDAQMRVDMERQKWSATLVDVYNQDRTKTKTKGQPFTNTILGKKRFDLLVLHKLVVMAGNHPQWNYAEFPDINDALRMMEEIGFFEV